MNTLQVVGVVRFRMRGGAAGSPLLLGCLSVHAELNQVLVHYERASCTLQPQSLLLSRWPHWKVRNTHIHKCEVTTLTVIIIIITIMYIYHVLINALSAHMIHINLNMIFYTHVEHSPTKTIYINMIKYYTKTKQKRTTNTHTHRVIDRYP